MLAILSPAKKLDFTTQKIPLKASQPHFIEEAKRLVSAARNLSKRELARTMNLSEKLADLNFERFKAFSPPFDLNNAKQAGFVFNGDTYVGLDFKSLKTADIKFAQKHLRILSGLFGILRPLDLIQPYRLEMGAKFQPNKSANLYDFWGDLVTQVLNADLREHQNKVVINLASNEYFKVIQSAKLKGSLLTPRFKEFRNGEYQTIGIFAKKARGMMARFMIEESLVKPEELKKFNKGGYKYIDELSDDKNWVFARPKK